MTNSWSNYSTIFKSWYHEDDVHDNLMKFFNDGGSSEWNWEYTPEKGTLFFTKEYPKGVIHLNGNDVKLIYDYESFDGLELIDYEDINEDLLQINEIYYKYDKHSKIFLGDFLQVVEPETTNQENVSSNVVYSTKPIYISRELYAILRPEFGRIDWEAAIQVSLYGDILNDKIVLSNTMIQALRNIKNGYMTYDDLLLYLIHPEHHQLIGDWIDMYLRANNGVKDGFITSLCDFIKRLGYSNFYVQTTVQGIMKSMIENDM
jgi:hypothetical protein